jgi:methyltransferase-like protein
MATEQLIQSVNNELALELPNTISLDELRKQLAQHLNHLIKNDFEKLVYYLYRIDVNEKKMKALLQSPHENSGELIAQLIIERQLEKIKTKQQFHQPKNDDDEDSW